MSKSEKCDLCKEFDVVYACVCGYSTPEEKDE